MNPGLVHSSGCWFSTSSFPAVFICILPYPCLKVHARPWRPLKAFQAVIGSGRASTLWLTDCPVYSLLATAWWRRVVDAHGGQKVNMDLVSCSVFSSHGPLAWPEIDITLHVAHASGGARVALQTVWKRGVYFTNTSSSVCTQVSCPSKLPVTIVTLRVSTGSCLICKSWPRTIDKIL